MSEESFKRLRQEQPDDNSNENNDSISSEKLDNIIVYNHAYNEIISQHTDNDTLNLETLYNDVDDMIKPLDITTDNGMKQFVVLLRCLVQDEEYKEVRVQINKEELKKLVEIRDIPDIEKLESVLSLLTES